jgi:type VI secretion system secreted protein Hcp
MSLYGWYVRTSIWEEIEMSDASYLYLDGIDGSCVQSGREGSVIVYAIDHQINRAMDPQGGISTGPLQHGVFVATKDIDKSSPKLHEVLVTGAIIPEAKFEFWSVTDENKEVNHYNIILETVRITGIKLEKPNALYPENADVTDREKVAFTYGKITWKYTDGNLSYTTAT